MQEKRTKQISIMMSVSEYERVQVLSDRMQCNHSQCLRACMHAEYSRCLNRPPAVSLPPATLLTPGTATYAPSDSE